MGAPKKEIKKIRNTFTLSKEAQAKINAVLGQQKSKVVSQLIEKYL